MFKLKWLVVLFWFVIAVQPSFADDRAKLLGIWQIVSYEWENQATDIRLPVMGKNPTGYMIFTPEGRMMVIIMAEGRKAPSTDQDRVALFNSMFAYTGMYRLEGDKYITKLDVAWHPARVGTELVRFFRFDGDRLQLISDWMPGTSAAGAMGRVITNWERAK